MTRYERVTAEELIKRASKLDCTRYFVSPKDFEAKLNIELEGSIAYQMWSSNKLKRNKYLIIFKTPPACSELYLELIPSNKELKLLMDLYSKKYRPTLVFQGKYQLTFVDRLGIKEDYYSVNADFYVEHILRLNGEPAGLSLSEQNLEGRLSLSKEEEK